MYSLLELSFVVTFFAFVQATAAYFLEFCFRPGNIFEGWLPWVEAHFYGTFWYKPLGGCVVCMNVWLGFAPAAVLVMLLGLSGAGAAVWWLVYLLLSNFFLRKML